MGQPPNFGIKDPARSNRTWHGEYLSDFWTFFLTGEIDGDAMPVCNSFARLAVYLDAAASYGLIIWREA